MKQLIYLLSVFFSSFLFSQDARDTHYLLNDLKIGVYESQNNSKDTLGIFIAQNNSKDRYSVCIDVFLDKRKDSYYGLGISIDGNRLDRLYRDLRVAQKEFQNRGDKNIVDNMRIGGQTPVEIYQWDSKEKNGPVNRINKKNKQKSYPLSIGFSSNKGQPELWIYTNGESSNPKEIAIVFKSIESINAFLNSIQPGLVRKQHHDHFTLKRRK